MNRSCYAEVLQDSNLQDYNDFFESCPHGLIQQSAYWSDIISPLSPDQPFFIVVRESGSKRIIAGLPLYFYQQQMGNILTSVPHAGPLGGVLAADGLDQEFRKNIYDQLLKKAMELAAGLNCIALTIITNPFINDVSFYMASDQPDFKFENFCQVIYLPDIFDENNHLIIGQRNINRLLAKAQEANIKISPATAEEFEPWYKIHVKRHNEIDVAPLPHDLLRNIVKILEHKNKGSLLIIKKDDEIVGGCIYIWHKEIADVFILSSNSSFLNFGINHAVTEYSVKMLKSKGIKWYNWQSSPRNSGVYEFKEKWGSIEKPYYFLTWKLEGFDRMYQYPVQEIKEAYKWHYLAPFQALTGKLVKGEFKK
jgi:hypothetical protein